MKDIYGRELDYLRISVTDRCDLRCMYCMPGESVEYIPPRSILTYEEIARTVRIMAGLGVKKVRLTGGEPFVRRDILTLVQMIRQTDGIQTVGITTNGITLGDAADKLKEIGADSVNISLDSADPLTYRQITGHDCLDKVLNGIDKALSLDMHIKLNCVPVRGINEKDICGLAEFARQFPIDVRYIELMPIGCGRQLQGVPSDEVLGVLEKRYGKAVPQAGSEISSPAVYHRFSGFRGRIGFISPMSHKFCMGCNRLRLTADGFLKLCLQYPAGADLRRHLRDGSSDEDIRELILETVKKKPLEHSFVHDPSGDGRKMFQ
ncbi:MAG: GTP 3',8-cyclase MoaA, partial [Oscillospiraceae bacterium]|nr:GTP 3',8-cyclase MoaA [Oscillospiraceae bacterium]